MKHKIIASLIRLAQRLNITILASFMIVGCGTSTNTSPNPQPPISGVLINSSSSIQFSPNSVVAYYDTLNLAGRNPTGTGYYVEISGAQGIAWLGIETNFIPELNTPYTLTNQNPDSIDWTSGQKSFFVTSTYIESPVTNGTNADSITKATVTFTSAPNNVGGNVVFTFSVSYSNGKTLSGTVNSQLVIDPPGLCSSPGQPDC